MQTRPSYQQPRMRHYNLTGDCSILSNIPDTILAENIPSEINLQNNTENRLYLLGTYICESIDRLDRALNCTTIPLYLNSDFHVSLHELNTYRQRWKESFFLPEEQEKIEEQEINDDM